MRVYRALSEQDEKQYQNEEDLICTCSAVNKPYYENFYASNNAFNNIKNSLDTIISHIDGEDLLHNLSPWISTSPSFSDAIKNYAIPKNNHYNTRGVRRPIAVMDIDGIYDDSDQLVDYLRDLYENSKKSKITHTGNFAIFVNKDKLKEFYNTTFLPHEEYMLYNIHIIDAKDSNSQIGPADYYYSRDDTREYEVPIYSMNTLDINEVLVYSNIPHAKIKFIVTPLLQDIIYASGKSVDDAIKDIDSIEQHVVAVYNSLQPDLKLLFNYLYCPDGNIHQALHYSGNCYSRNLVDIAQAYNTDIVTNFHELRMAKRMIFEGINKELGSSLSYPKLVDDRMYVGIIDKEVDSPISLTANSLVLLQDGQKVVKVKEQYSLRQLREMPIRYK